MAEQWYTNKELHEMMMDFTGKIEKLGAELEKTQTMIRDYNGLRERLGKCERRLDRNEGQDAGSHSMWGYIVGALGVIFALISFAMK